MTHAVLERAGLFRRIETHLDQLGHVPLLRAAARGKVLHWRCDDLVDGARGSAYCPDRQLAKTGGTPWRSCRSSSSARPRPTRSDVSATNGRRPPEATARHGDACCAKT